MQSGLVLVTGANGFVGKWTVLELLRAGFSVRGTVRSESRAEAVRAAVRAHVGEEALSRLTFIRLDLMRDDRWAEAMAGIDAIVHVAAHLVDEEPKDMQVVVGPALEGTERVLRFAVTSGVKRIVMTSSVATVGYGHGLVAGRQTYAENDFTDLDGMYFSWAYCIGKTMAEQTAWAYARNEDLALTTIHPGAILGPALDADVSTSLQMVSGVLDGSAPVMPSNGFSVVDVRDVAAMHVAALQQPETVGQRYLAASDYIPFPQVGRILAEAYPERNITQKTLPDWIIKLLARFGGPMRQIINDIGNEKHYSRDKGEALLGRRFISGKDAVLATAASLIRLGLLKPKV
ncbi:NAD-dependent epimerase/dehydratase family protein [Devosia sp. 2618]|uniref:NAD-dependent epimerase/dehydratase family protein n=1 Tax=Devosia sp. 2618 TaxID=3156454 RepID=UPI0033963433